MRYGIAILFGILLLCGSANSQVGVDWSRQFDHENGTDCFNDIYAISDGGYITCGLSDGMVWLVRMNDNGDQVWSRTYGNEDDGCDAVWTIIESDSGNFLVGMERGTNMSALLVDGRGEVIWWNDYGEGICHALIELKSGEFILVGHGNGDASRAGRLVKVDTDGEVIWDKLYDPGYCDFYYLKETEGGIVIAGCIASLIWGNNPTNFLTCLVKFDFEGELVWARSYHIVGGSIGRGIAATPDGGFAVTGHASISGVPYNDGQMYLLKVSSVGAQEWVRTYNNENESSIEFAWSIFTSKAGGFAIVGRSYDTRNELGHMKVLRTTDMGLTHWKRLIGSYDDGFGECYRIMLYSVIQGQDSTILAAGNIVDDEGEEGYNGFIVKLEPEQYEPMSIYYEPRDSVLKVLPRGRIDFLIRAIGEPVGELSRLWTLNGDVRSNDSTVTIPFTRMGENEVCCYIADERYEAAVSWKVFVDDLFIVWVTPPETSLLVRRRSSIDFSIDSVATIYDPAGLDYYWTVANLQTGDREEVNAGNSISYQLDQSGEYAVEGLVVRGDLSDEVHWNVDVRGLIRTYEPLGHDLRASRDSTLRFEIVPMVSDPSNLYRFFVDGSLLSVGSDSVLITIFDTDGIHDVLGILSDSLDADTVHWVVTVEESDGVRDKRDAFPTRMELLSVSPNPFNSMVTIRYAGGSETAATRLVAYDISGRVVADFGRDEGGGMRDDGTVGYGDPTVAHKVVWDATGQAARIYFARLESGGELKTVKMVLVR